MKKRLIIALFSLIQIISAEKSFSQELDSGFVTKNNPFLKDLLARKENIDPVQAPASYMFAPKLKVYAEKGQLLIKSSNNFYVSLLSTGFLYQLYKETDSLLYFKRIDKTYNINYNVDAKWFCLRDEIFNLGGYGFWKSNGTLRKYNFKDNEWDVQPLNQEIYTPAKSSFVWFDFDSSIYIPFEQNINSGLFTSNLKTGTLNKNVYKLNLKTNNWSKLGALSPGLAEKIDETPWVLMTKEGYLLIGHEDLYLVDFQHNAVRIHRNSSTAQSFLRINDNF